jgi:hypothetical protein
MATCPHIWPEADLLSPHVIPETYARHEPHTPKPLIGGGCRVQVGDTLRSTGPMIGRVEGQHPLIEDLRIRTGPLRSAQLLANRLGMTTRTTERDIAELT